MLSAATKSNAVTAASAREIATTRTATTAAAAGAEAAHTSKNASLYNDKGADEKITHTKKKTSAIEIFNNHRLFVRR